MPKSNLEIRLDGVEPFLAKLVAFSPKVRRGILRKALRTASGPVKKEMRKAVRQLGAVRFKHLAKSIREKLKTYPSGVVFLAVGARRKKLPDGENPGNYGHLVGGGTKPHGKKKNLDKPWRFRDEKTGQWITLKGKRHPGAKAKDFRNVAARISQRKISSAFGKRVDDLITKELAK